MSKNLFADDSDGNNEIEALKLNEEYAKSYNKFRQKEFKQKLKDQNKNNGYTDDTSSSDYESTDEEDEIVNPKFDKEFFRTLSSLKSKDPTIYDKNTSFFDEVKNNDGIKKKKTSKKAITLKDYERKIILERHGNCEDHWSDTEVGLKEEQQRRSESLSYADEQKKLRDEIRTAINNNDSDEEFGGIFKKRKKTNEERVKEEDDFTQWLSGEQNNNIKDVTQKALHPLKQFWNNPTLSKPEKFLRDYILNKGYVDKYESEIPTYDQIVGNEENLSDDEKELEKQADFEQKYNFRFEEPDTEFIKRYPRTIENSVRRTDDSRKQKREETKERKIQEKQEKMKELEILKEVKRQEIQEKIEKLKEVTGNEELPFDENEFDDEFNPEAHDKKMQAIFNDDYYGMDDGDEKPECPHIEELQIEDWDNYDPGEEDTDKIPNCEDDDFNMDCDYYPDSKKTLQNELIENTKDRRKGKKKRNQFKEMIKKEKPPFNPDDEKTYEEYINEYYQMDCEDMIGDVPCRFKYVETVPNDFGLTIEEILLAKNKELNQWASLKKATQIRSEHVERNERSLYQMKAKNQALKRKIFISLYGDGSDRDEDNKDMATEIPENNPFNTTQHVEKNKKKKKRNKKRKISVTSEEPPKMKHMKKVKFVKENTLSKNTNEVVEWLPDNIVHKKVKKIVSPAEISTAPIHKPATFEQKSSNPPELSKTLSSESYVKQFKTQTRQNKTSMENKNTENKDNIGKMITKPDFGLSDDRLKAYGINPKKFNKKQKFFNLCKKWDVSKKQFKPKKQ